MNSTNTVDLELELVAVGVPVVILFFLAYSLLYAWGKFRRHDKFFCVA